MNRRTNLTRILAPLLLSSWVSLQGQTLFEENFDSVTLGPNVDEGEASDMAWTAEPPAGWTVDNSKMPMADGEVLGTTEWRGWTFADPAWWASVDDQRRSEFINAGGAAAVADPDEWDDVGGPAGVGNFESYLISPTIDVSGVAGTPVSLSFDFSWRPEGNQTGNVTVAFNGGEAQEVFRLDTATSSDDMTNESKTLNVVIPADATELVLTFGMFDAGNNWFWAIDNILIKAAKLFEENFDSAVLGPNVDEGEASDLAWTAEPPAGWTVDNSKMPMADGEVLGTTEWRGWTFADPAWWASVDDQRRSDFTKASGVAAVADPDEWDDVGSPAGVGNFESYLISPPFDVSSVAGGSASLRFDFSWRPEGNQTGNVTVAFDGGDAVEIFRLDTATTSDDMTNETKTVPFAVPAGASEVTLSFGMFDAGNNWFWAVDNIDVIPSAEATLPSNLVGVGDPLGKKVTLTWNPASNIVGTIEVLRDGEVIAEVPIDASEYVDQSPPGIDAEGRITFTYGLRVKAEDVDAEPLSQEIVYSTGAASRTLFEESFDSVTLGESVEEGGLGEGMDWTAEPPAGWTVDNSKMPMDAGEVLGTTEWRGWTFADPLFWAQVDDQRRSEFVNASGAAAIADPDEWDDSGNPAGVGNFESYLISPPVDVTAEAGGNVSIVFDSSWRPEGNQTGNLTVTFDGGQAQEVLRLDTGTTSDNETNEVKVVSANIPAGAKEMVLTFGMFDAGNNWFWAIDNVVVTTQAVPICPTGISAGVDKEASAVNLSWIAGANLGDATIQIWRDGAMIAEGLAFDATTYVDQITLANPDDSSIFEYEVRVIDSPEECVPLTRTVVFSQGALQKLAQWDFEEGSGVTTSNSLGDGLSGDLVDLSDGAWVNPGFLGGALQFEGDGYIDLGTSEADDDIRAKSDALRPLAGLTLAAWVKPDEFAEWAGIAGSVFDSGSNEGGFYMNTRTPSDFSFALATEADGTLTYLRAEGVPGEWSHVVGTYDGQQQKLYLNGELVASRDTAGPIDYDPAPYGFQIGTFIDDNEDVRFVGQISQVAMWNGALAEDEINLLYEIGRAGENIDPALDSDGDGLLDEWEVANFGNLTDQSALDDPDGDQLINLAENKADSDPNKEDTDDDGVTDSTEVAFGSDPTDGGAKPADNAVALSKSNSASESWASPNVWSNGEAPSGGKIYFANGEFATNLRTPAEGGGFAGDSLELFNGAHLVVQGPNAALGDLILKSGRIVHGGANGSTVRVGGSGDAISVVEPGNIFFTQNQGVLEIGSTISGDQKMTLTASSPFRGGAFEGGTVVLLGANSEFTGGWEVEGVTLKAGARNSLGKSDINLINGTLDPDVPVNLPEQKLTLNGGLVKIVLDQDMAFAAVSVGDQFDFPEGTYTAGDLLGLGFTDENVVDGGGVLVVGGEIDPGPDPDPDPDPSPGGEFYSQDFEAADGATDLGDGSIIASNDGTNSVQGGVLRVTEAGTNSTAASFILPPFDASAGWSASFDFTIEHTGDNTPADGFSFNYGAIPDGENFGDPAEEGYGGATPHVSFQVDTWLWDDAAGQDAGVGIEVTGAEVALTKATDDVANFKPNERVSATAFLSWDPANGASFVTTGLRTNADFVNVATAGFTAEATHGFSILARTGGHNETLEIDNLVVGELGSISPGGGGDVRADLGAVAISTGPRTEAGVVDFGDLSGDATYEFSFNALKDGASTAIAGNDVWGLKLDQWNEQGVFGTTQFGVADNIFTALDGKSVSSVFGADVRVTIVSDSTGGETRLYVNGDLVGTIAGSFELAGEVQIMAARIAAPVDFMGAGSVMHGWATYNTALSGDDIAALSAEPFPVNEGPDGSTREITGVSFTAAGVSLALPEGTTYDIEFSTDLVNWSVIASDVSGSYDDTDAGRAAGGEGYYRGVVK